MSESKPIPVRLSDPLIARLDAVAQSVGTTRAALMRLCTTTFIDYLDRVGAAGLPMDWQKIIEEMDGRRSVLNEAPSEEPLPPPKKVVFVAKKPPVKKPKSS